MTYSHIIFIVKTAIIYIRSLAEKFDSKYFDIKISSMVYVVVSSIYYDYVTIIIQTFVCAQHLPTICDKTVIVNINNQVVF